MIEAAAHGVHVIVEKPLTISAADGERIVEAVEKAGIHLVVGPSRGNDPVVRTMRDIVLSGEVGRVAMVNCWNYTDFLYRPRRPEELDTSKGGGIIFNQMPHAIDSVKAISNEKVVAVRAVAGSLDPQRPTEGHCAAFLTLANGVAASIVYSGYDHFDTDELQFWIGEVGNPKTASHGSARKVLRELKGREQDLRVQRYGYGGPVAQGLASLQAKRKQAHFGVIVATCERADLRPSPDGVLVYGDEGVREVPAVRTQGGNRLSDTTIDELHDAITGQRAGAAQCPLGAGHRARLPGPPRLQSHRRTDHPVGGARVPGDRRADQAVRERPAREPGAEQRRLRHREGDLPDAAGSQRLREVDPAEHAGGP